MIHNEKLERKKPNRFGVDQFSVSDLEWAQKFNFQCIVRPSQPNRWWGRWVHFRTVCLNRTRLLSNDGLPFSRRSSACVEWRWDFECIYKYICELEIRPVYSRSGVHYFLDDAVHAHLHNHIGHIGYHLCELLVFEKEVQVHVAFGVFG